MRRQQQEVDSERLRTRRLRQAAAALARHRRQAEFVTTVEARVSASAVSKDKQDLARRCHAVELGVTPRTASPTRLTPA